MTEQDALHEIIKAQREELHRLAAVEPEIRRQGYEEAAAALPQPLIKVILGPRRAGKSTFCRQLLRGKRFAYLNFDDEGLLQWLSLHSTAGVEAALDLTYGKFDFLLLDEIQNVRDWELFVNRLQRRGRNLIVTGSNAHLLSRELASHLTGRYLAFLLWPFSWTEFKEAKPQSAVVDYLTTGGFPEVVLTLGRPQPYLQTLAQASILKDIAGRYKIRRPHQVLALYSALTAQFAQCFTISKLARTLNFSSKTTLEKYLSHLEEAFLVIELRRYSHKAKEQLKAPRKIYLPDLGFVSNVNYPFDINSRRFENAVFLHLQRGIKSENELLFYYHTKEELEVDFLLKEGHRVKRLIQASYSLERGETLARETAALCSAAKELDCQSLTIVTLTVPQQREIESQGAKIEVVGLEEFLNGPASQDLP